MFGELDMSLSDSDDDYVPQKEELALLDEQQGIEPDKFVSDQTKDLFRLI